MKLSSDLGVKQGVLIEILDEKDYIDNAYW